MSDSNKKIRFGILGTSRIAKKSAIPALIASDEAELAMIGSRSIESAAACASEFGSPAYGTYEDVLRNPDVDAVYISLPNSLHEEWSVKAASAGKHVWCEKPAAITYTSARRMVDACRKNGVRLMEGFTFLQHPQHALVRKIIASGKIGEVISFTGTFAYPRPESGDIRMDKTLGGGVLFDASVYPIRASSMIFGEDPESVECALTIDPEIGIDTHADLTLTYPDGFTASVMAEFSDDYRSTYTVTGSRGSIRMERAYAVPFDRVVRIFLQTGEMAEEIAIPATDQFKLTLEEFCREIRLGDRSEKNYEQDLLRQARILDAARQSQQGECETVL